MIRRRKSVDLRIRPPSN